MALYQIDVEKAYNNETWTNVYYVDAPDLETAGDAGERFVEMERSFHKTVVLFSRVRARSAVEGDDIYTTRIINLFGLQPTFSGSFLPLFNVVRVDLGATQGRPSRKFYRTPILEDEQTNAVLDGAYVGNVQGALDAALADFSAGTTRWTDVDGQFIIAAQVFAPVGMRQLRRGSRRRATPVLP